MNIQYTRLDAPVLTQDAPPDMTLILLSVRRAIGPRGRLALPDGHTLPRLSCHAGLMMHLFFFLITLNTGPR